MMVLLPAAQEGAPRRGAFGEPALPEASGTKRVARSERFYV